MYLEDIKKDYDASKLLYAEKCKVYDEMREKCENDSSMSNLISMMRATNEMQDAYNSMQLYGDAYHTVKKISDGIKSHD